MYLGKAMVGETLKNASGTRVRAGLDIHLAREESSGQ
jgi:hypothetical protein